MLGIKRRPAGQGEQPGAPSSSNGENAESRTETEARAEILPIRAMLPITIYGFSLFWAWNFLTFYSPVLAGPEVDFDARTLARLCMLLGMAAAALLSSIRPRIYDLNLTRVALIVALALTLPANLIGFLEPALQVPLAVRLVAWFASGCAFALMLAEWSSLFVISWRHDIGARVALAVVIGAVHALLAANLVPSYDAIAAVALPAFSVIIFSYVRSHAHVMSFSAAGTRTSAILPPGMSVVIALYGILFAVPAYILLRDGSPATMAAMAGALALGALSYFGYVRALDRYIPFASVMKVLLPCSVIGFFLLPFLTGQPQMLCAAALLAILVILDVANLSTLIARSYEHAFPPAQLVAAGRIYLALGKAIGWAACYLFLPMDFAFPHISAIVLLGSILVLALAVALIPMSVHMVADSNGSTEMGPGGRFAQRLSRTSAKYGLSDREQEVLRFLAKGRHAQYIGTALQISPHTAKTHIYHIYRKLGVSSLEELMDVVERIEQ